MDDDPDMRKMAQDYLAPKGCLVSPAADGAAALKLITADPPEVILLDIGLPDVPGTGDVLIAKIEPEGVVTVKGKGYLLCRCAAYPCEGGRMPHSPEPSQG